jgi:hypothetical protein
MSGFPSVLFFNVSFSFSEVTTEHISVAYTTSTLSPKVLLHSEPVRVNVMAAIPRNVACTVYTTGTEPKTIDADRCV